MEKIKTALLLTLAILLLWTTLSYAQRPRRDSLYEMFGPKLTEAVVGVLLDEINTVRVVYGLPPRTKADIDTAIALKLTSTVDYDWMDD